MSEIYWTTKPPTKEGWYCILDHYYDGTSKMYFKTIMSPTGELTYWSNKKKSPVSVDLIDDPKIILREWSSENYILPERMS